MIISAVTFLAAGFLYHKKILNFLNEQRQVICEGSEIKYGGEEKLNYEVHKLKRKLTNLNSKTEKLKTENARLKVNLNKLSKSYYYYESKITIEN